MKNNSTIPDGTPRVKPFFKNDDLQITTLRDRNRITGFEVIYKEKKSTFLVTEKEGLTKCFIKLENYISKL